MSRTRVGFRWLLLAAAAALAGLVVAAQQPPTTEPELPATVLRVTTRLVLVDVIVTDNDGNPVTDLTRQDFQILEDGKPQRLATFSFETPGRRAAVQPPPLPPNVHSNRPEYRLPPGPLTLLLLDGLNTPFTDQAYAREQMLRYVQTQLKADQRTAILALTTQLLLLQDFTDDPKLLQAALEKFTAEKSSIIARGEPFQVPPGVPVPARVLERLERLNFERLGGSTDARVQITLGALDAIARATAGYRGRKNLVWVSAVFPFTLLPDRGGDMDLARSYADEIRRVAARLADAQVAVYPVDARGLVKFSEADLHSPDRQFPGPVLVPGEDVGEERLTRGVGQVISSQQAMNRIAEDTGGRAYYNRNDIDAAVNLSIADGSTYYSLGYYPEKEKWDGKFRRLEVKVTREDVKVRHRRGYYAFDPLERLKPEEVKGEKETKVKDQELLAALSDPLPATVVTFLAHVPLPTASLPGFAATVTVQFLVDAKTLSFEETGDGRRRFDADFLVAAFGPEGKIVKSANHTVGAPLSAPSYARALEQGLPYEMKLELEPGRYHLRLVVRDNRTGLVGTTDVPLIVSKP